jgi:hypothetical protein
MRRLQWWMKRKRMHLAPQPDRSIDPGAGGGSLDVLTPRKCYTNDPAELEALARAIRK